MGNRDLVELRNIEAQNQGFPDCIFVRGVIQYEAGRGVIYSCRSAIWPLSRMGEHRALAETTEGGDVVRQETGRSLLAISFAKQLA